MKSHSGSDRSKVGWFLKASLQTQTLVVYMYVPAVDSSRIIQLSTALHSLPHIRAHMHTRNKQYSMTSEMGTSPLSGLWPAKDCPGEVCSLLFSFIRMPPRLSLFSLLHCIVHTHKRRDRES